MMQNIMAKPKMACQKLTFNTPEIDAFFKGFTLGEFAIIHGSTGVSALAQMLCVRAQLPTQLGGFGSNVIYIDCADTYKADKIAWFAQMNHLSPQNVRQRIYNFSTFTPYQLTTFILEKLEEKICSYNSKLVVVSDIAGLFLDSSISREEAQKAYCKILTFLVSLAQKHQIVVIATYPEHESCIRNIAFKEMALSVAYSQFSYYKTTNTAELNLEKHPTYMLGTAEPPTGNMSLTSFF
jgi:hypothetical protein